MIAKHFLKSKTWVFWIIILLVAVAFIGIAPKSAEAFEREIKVLSEQLGNKMLRKRARRIAVLDFVDLEGRVRGLGRFLAEELSTAFLTNVGALRVVDRANLSRIMREHRLNASGLIDPANARKLGRLSGVGALVVGTITPTGRKIRLQLRVISTETAVVLAAAASSIEFDNSLKSLWRQILATSSQRSSGPLELGSNQPRRFAARTERVAQNRYIEVTLKTLARTRHRYRRTPTLGISFVLKNRTNSQMHIQFQNKGLVYHDTSGINCVGGTYSQGFNSNLGNNNNNSNRFLNRNATMLGAGSSMFVNGTGMQCKGRKPSSPGFLSITFLAAVNGRARVSQVQFEDVELTGRH